MKTLLLILIMASFSARAASHLAGPAPEIGIHEALPLALASAKKHLSDANDYHVIEASYSFHGGETLYWLITFAKPSAGFFFVGVYPGGKVVGDMRQAHDSSGKFIGPPENKN